MRPVTGARFTWQSNTFMKTLTRSIGTRLAETPERWGWADAGGVRAELVRMAQEARAAA